MARYRHGAARRGIWRNNQRNMALNQHGVATGTGGGVAA